MAGFEPAAAYEWDAEGLSPEDATAWSMLTLEPHEARRCIAGGAGPEDVARQESAGVLPSNFAALVGLVPTAEIPAWEDALIARDLLDARDVPLLVKAGLAAFHVSNAPEDLTAGEIIRFYTDAPEWPA